MTDNDNKQKRGLSSVKQAEQPPNHWTHGTPGGSELPEIERWDPQFTEQLTNSVGPLIPVLG